MPYLKGPDFITLQVRDLEASRRFYAEVIGFPISPEVRPNAVAFATQPISFAIRKSQVDLDAVPQLGHGVVLWFLADDAAALQKHLIEHGTTIVPERDPSYTAQVFRDEPPPQAGILRRELNRSIGGGTAARARLNVPATFDFHRRLNKQGGVR